MNKSNNAWLGKTLKATANLIMFVVTVYVFAFIIGLKERITIDFPIVVSWLLLFGTAAMIVLLEKGRKSDEESTRVVCTFGLVCHIIFYVISFEFFMMHF